MRKLSLLLLSFILITANAQTKYNDLVARVIREELAKIKQPEPACGCDITIPASAWYVDVDKNANSNAYVITPKPGQTVCFASGTRGTIEIHDIAGTAENPITFRSCGGTIFKGNQGQRVVTFMASSFIRFLGDDGSGYGSIELTGGGHGLYFSERSTDAECGFVRMVNLGYSGFEAKTDPTCDPLTWRGAFIMRNIWLHDCYISTLTGEGAYIGESHYATVGAIQRGPCSSGKTTAKEHEVIGVRVENNIFDGTGADAIQIGAATTGCVVTKNTITGYGSAKVMNQNAGIILNEGTVADVFGNVINGGYGYAIQSMGPGGSTIHHNLIINAGTGGLGGIMQANRPVEGVTAGRQDRIYNNTIVNATGKGIEYFNNPDVRDNIINVKTGGVVMKQGGSVAGVTDIGNIKLVGNPEQLKLDANYVPQPGSPAFGVDSDAGAFQSIKIKWAYGPGWEASDSLGTIKAWLVSGDGKKIRVK